VPFPALLICLALLCLCRLEYDILYSRYVLERICVWLGYAGFLDPAVWPIKASSVVADPAIKRSRDEDEDKQYF
jgi:hypothetical protein